MKKGKMENAAYLYGLKKKLWITESVDICVQYTYMFDQIYKSTMTTLNMLGGRIKYDDFVKIAESLKELEIGTDSIINDDEEPLALGDIASILPNLRDLTMSGDEYIEIRSSSTLSLPYFPKLDEFTIEIYDDINIYDLCEFIKMHPKRTFKISVWYRDLLGELQQAFCKLFPQATSIASVENGYRSNRHKWFMEYDNTLIKLSSWV